VHADKIYRTHANRNWCKEHDIRLSGLPLGRPPKDPEKNMTRRKQIQEDEGIRNAVEGKFGQGKRRFGLNRIMARLAESSQTVVSIIFLMMNLEQWLMVYFLRFLSLLKPSLQAETWLLHALNRHQQHDFNTDPIMLSIAC
jgi:transposase, IS5 family